MFKAAGVFVAAAMLLVSMGCATIIHGTSQDVGISSSPSNATVWANGQQLGKTPLNTKLARKDNHIIRVELPGYLPYETTFNRSVSGWVWGNLVFGGLIGLAVDAVSGGLYKLTPEQVNAELRSSNDSDVTYDDGLYVFVTLQADPEWKKIDDLVASSE